MAEPAEQEFLRSIFLMEAWDTVAALDRAASEEIRRSCVISRILRSGSTGRRAARIIAEAAGTFSNS